MFQKTLIRCPRCELEGRTKTIGLIFPNGAVSIQREFIPARGNDEPKRDYTIIQGRDFSLVCGYCGEVVYRKEAKSEIYSSFWLARISGGTLGSRFGTA